MLIPLFGLQLLVTIYRPKPNLTNGHLYEIATAAVSNSQVQYSSPCNNFSITLIKLLKLRYINYSPELDGVYCISFNQKDGYRQRNMRQFLQSA